MRWHPSWRASQTTLLPSCFSLSLSSFPICIDIVVLLYGQTHINKEAQEDMYLFTIQSGIAKRLRRKMSKYTPPTPLYARAYGANGHTRTFHTTDAASCFLFPFSAWLQIWRIWLNKAKEHHTVLRSFRFLPETNCKYTKFLWDAQELDTKKFAFWNKK